MSPTVVQFPTRPVNEYTPREQREAKQATYTGTLRRAADLWRAAITENGVFAGLMSTITHGLLGLPLNLQGDPAMCAALLDAEGTPGEYGQLFPEDETAAVMADGLGFGIGLGQMIMPCDPMTRPVGGHIVPHMKWWDPRDLRQDPYTRQWYLLTRDGEIPITPGDGEWIMYTPYPDTDAWRHGPWIYITLAFIFSRDAVYDRQRHAEVLAPVRVGRAVKPTTPAARKKFLAELGQMMRDNCLVLPEQWEYEIVESAGTGRITEVYKAIVEWANNDVEVGLTGNAQALNGPTGFSNGNIYSRVTDSKRRFFAKTWFTCARDQGLTYWAWDNYGTTNAPTGGYNVESPEDALARAKALGEWGEGLGKLAAGLQAVGRKVDPTWVDETMRRQGVRTVATEEAQAPAVEPATQGESPALPAIPEATAANESRAA